MRDVLAPGTVLGYCTNVHAGTTLEEVAANLDRYATAVRARVSPLAPMGIGLWLPATAARALRDPPALAAFATWLEKRGLEAFTINGFPYGDFHRPVVKREVYRPDWTRPERLDYTIDLMHIAAALAGKGEASVSTLPVGWPTDVGNRAALRLAAERLRAAARAAAGIEEATGVLVHLDLEPEPGCVLDTAEDVTRFFGEHLAGDGDGDGVLLRRHLRVCHDVCHAAVMFEDQEEMLRLYDEAGVAIGKVQVSSAVRARFGALSERDRARARAELAAFGEDRYLHQTMVAEAGGAERTLHEDLPEALRAAPPAPSGEWRVHYHVPVYLERFGLLETTRDEISACLALLRERGDVRHYEVETYAWEILPAELREDDLAEGIARELEWVIAQAGGGEGQE